MIGTSLIADYHRRLGDTLECPDCRYRTKSIEEWLEDIDHIVDVRKENVIVFSVCAMCGSVSWAHYKREKMGFPSLRILRYQDFLLRMGVDRVVVIQDDSPWADSVIDGMKLIKVLSRYREPVGKDLSSQSYPVPISDVNGVVLVGESWIVKTLNLKQFDGQLVSLISNAGQTMYVISSAGDDVREMAEVELR